MDVLLPVVLGGTSPTTALAVAGALSLGAGIAWLVHLVD